MGKMKYIKMFELFDADELRGELEKGRKRKEILDRFFPDGYKGSEWYEKMKQYEKEIWAIIREAEDPKNMPKALLDSLGQSDPLEVKCHNRKGWGGYMFIEPEARAMIYFDNLDEAKEREILDKAAEIEEYSKLGHDSAWTISMNSLLGQLKSRMSIDGYCDAELWDANKKEYVPYVFKKRKMFEEFNFKSDETARYTYYDIRDYENVGRAAVTLYPKQKGSRDSFTLCDSSDVANIKDRLEREGIYDCKVVYGPYYFGNKIDPKCLTVIASKEDEKKIREIGSMMGFASSYAH